MSNKMRLALDAGMLAAVLLASNPRVTGIAVHEWLSFSLLVAALFHLALNWRWVVHVTEKVFDRLRAMSRMNYVVDIGLYVSIVAVSLSGVLVMPGVAEALGASRYAWHLLHVASSDTTVLFALTHAALHWRWIAGVLGRAVPGATRPAAVGLPARRES